MDNGSSFSGPVKISDDRWIIEGCPHTGASMTAKGDQLEVVWFTAGGLPGLYRASSTDRGKNFHSRELIAENGFHPQIASFGNFSAVVMEEKLATEHVQTGHQTHGHATHDGSIVLWLSDELGNRTRKVVDNQGGEFPVVTFINRKELLVAYTRNGRVVVTRATL